MERGEGEEDLMWRTQFSSEKNKERCRGEKPFFFVDVSHKEPFPSAPFLSRPAKTPGERGRGLLPTPTMKRTLLQITLLLWRLQSPRTT